MTRGAVSLSAVVAVMVALGVASRSHAQRAVAGGTVTVTLGDPVGAAITERLDGRRSNASRERLPARALRVLWTRQGRPTLHAPVVTRDGEVIVVGNQGDTLVLNADGTDRAHLALGPGPMSAPAILTDGTVVVVNGAGAVLGLRRGEIAFHADVAGWGAPGPDPTETTVTINAQPRTHSGGPRAGHFVLTPSDANGHGMTRAFLLPTDDGGFALGFDRSLLLLDGEATVRSRTFTSFPVTSPLLALAHSVAVVTESGDAYEWDLSSAPGAVHARGSFGGVTGGVVAVPDDRHLLAVVDHARLVSLDVRTGVAETRTSAPPGSFTDTFALGSGSSFGGTAFLEETTFTGTRVVAVGRDGQATPFGPNLSSRRALPSLDGGARMLPPSGTRLFSDPSGALAYATVDGHVGVVTPTEKVELGGLPCGAPPEPNPGAVSVRVHPVAPFAGLVPARPDAFVVVCAGGDVSYVEGAAE